MVWHHSLPLINSFNKTETAVFSCRLCFLGAFPFISLSLTPFNYIYKLYNSKKHSMFLLCDLIATSCTCNQLELFFLLETKQSLSCFDIQLYILELGRHTLVLFCKRILPPICLPAQTEGYCVSSCIPGCLEHFFEYFCLRNQQIT